LCAKLKPCKSSDFLRLLRNRARLEQVGEVISVRRIAQKWSDMEDFLHRAQIRRMSVIERTRIRNTIYIRVSNLRDNDLANRMIEVIAIIARDAVGFRFVPPNDNHAVVLVGV